MEMLLAVMTILFAIISVCCASYTCYLREDINMKVVRMKQLRDEVVEYADDALKLVKDVSEDLEQMKPKEPHFTSQEEYDFGISEIEEMDQQEEVKRTVGKKTEI